MDTLKQLMERYNSLSAADWRQWKDISVIKQFRKDEALIREGEIAKVCAFVLQGCFKNSIVNPNGEEKILKFSFESDFLASCTSYNCQVPSGFSIVAMEPSLVMVTNNNALVQLCGKNSSVANLGFVLTQKLMQQHEEHLKLLSYANPVLRYEYILDHYPDLLNKVSLTDLAKYLYVSREALSRARNQLVFCLK